MSINDNFNLKQNVETNLNYDLRKMYIQQLKQSINNKKYLDEAISYIISVFIL